MDPSHRDHEGNEKADELARTGSELTTTLEDVRPPLNSIKRKIHGRLAALANEKWKLK